MYSKFPMRMRFFAQNISRILRDANHTTKFMSTGKFSREIENIGPEDLPEKPISDALKNYQEQVDKFISFSKKAIEGGGSKGVERHVIKNNKVLVRDRIKMLLDVGSPFFEIGQISGFEMFYGDIPSAATVCGIGRINGVYCMISGNDATVKGGTYFPITVQKSHRSQEIGETNRLPCIYMPDSGGAFLPLQSEIFPDRKHGGRSFYNQAIMSSMGIHQLAVVCGSCTAGGAYNPTMSDEVVMVDQIGKIYLGGPPLVKAATGEIVTDEDLGGAWLHCSVSGCTDYFAKDEKQAFEICRDIVESLNMETVESKEYEEPKYEIENWNDYCAREHLSKTEVYAIIASILDGSKFKEFKSFFGPGLIVGVGYIQGNMIGIVANSDEILSAESQKAAHFMDMCSRRKTPVLFLQNSLPAGSRNFNKLDQTVLKDRAKMISTLATVSVEKIGITMTSCSEDDYLLMCGPSFNPNFNCMWPNSRMSGFPMEASERMNASVDGETFDAFYSAFNILTDAIILPQNTREVVGEMLRIFLQKRLNPYEKRLSPVLRM